MVWRCDPPETASLSCGWPADRHLPESHAGGCSPRSSLCIRGIPLPRESHPGGPAHGPLILGELREPARQVVEPLFEIGVSTSFSNRKIMGARTLRTATSSSYLSHVDMPNSKITMSHLCGCPQSYLLAVMSQMTCAKSFRRPLRSESLLREKRSRGAAALSTSSATHTLREPPRPRPGGPIPRATPTSIVPLVVLALPAARTNRTARGSGIQRNYRPTSAPRWKRPGAVSVKMASRSPHEA